MSEPALEQSLGDPADQVAVVDTTVPPTPENFDLTAWLDGVRPTRRAVKVFANGGLVARMEQIAQQIDDAPGDVDPGSQAAADVDALIEEFYRVKAEFQRGVWFVFEARSSEWIRKFRNDVSRELNLKVKVDSEGAFVEDDPELFAPILYRQLAEQIVEPAGVTAAAVERLRSSAPGEFGKLLRCLNDCNQRVAEAAEVMSRDFSVRRSDATLES